MTQSGKEHILQFAPEDWWISDLDSFLTDKPSEIFIMAIEDSEVIVVRKDSPLNYQLLNRPQLEDLCSTLLKNIVASNRRLIALLASTAEERTDLHFLN